MFDANAAGPVQPRAWEAYLASWQAQGADSQPGAAAQRLQATRKHIAAALGAPPATTVHLTSGGTEAAAYALWALLQGQRARRPQELLHCVTSAVEHAAVSSTLQQLQARWGTALEVDVLPVPRDGQLRPAAVAAALRPNTALVSVVGACNETGVMQPLAQLATLCGARGVLLHSDVVQLVGRVPMAWAGLWQAGLSALSLSAHKLGGVGGCGATLVAASAGAAAPLWPDSHRAAGGAALASALSPDTAAGLEAQCRRTAALRDGFEAALQQALGEVEVLGAAAPRLPNTSCLRFAGCAADGLLMALDVRGFSVSTGSACSSGALTPSPILLGMGLSADEARQTLRFSFSPAVDAAALAPLQAAVVAVVRRARHLQTG